MNVGEWLRGVISRHFYIIEERPDHDAILYYVDVKPESAEAAFDQLRRDLLGQGFIPMLVFEGGEYLLHVSRRPDVTYRSTTWNRVLLALTILSTIFVGTINWALYMGKTDYAAFFTADDVLNGALYFALPLMAILGTHEMGHYVVARRHGVAASLPFFIPMPLPPLGTFGAFISMRDPIPDNKALMDIGFAGPIAGFVVAVPVTLLGLHLTNVVGQPIPTDESGLVDLGTSLLFGAFLQLVPTSGDFLLHPTALAGWAGLLVTFLNLLPAGQLDGGHISRAMFGSASRHIGIGVLVLMAVLAVWKGYFGWVVFVLLILFLGINHPPPLNDVSRLTRKRWVVGAMAFLMLAVTFTTAPLVPVEPHYGFDAVATEPVLMLQPQEVRISNISINLTGNTADRIEVRLDPFAVAALLQQGWNVSLVRSIAKDGTQSLSTKSASRTFHIGAPGNISLRVGAPDLGQQPLGASVALPVGVRSVTDHSKKTQLTLILRLGTVSLESGAQRVDAPGDGVATLPLVVRHFGPANASGLLSSQAPRGWQVTFNQSSFAFQGESTTTVLAHVQPPSGAPAGPAGNLTVILTCVIGTGTGSNGTGVQTLNTTVVLPLSVGRRGGAQLSDVPQQLQLHNGSTLLLHLTLANSGNGVDRFQTSALTDPTLPLTVTSPADVTLAQGANTTLELELRAPVGVVGSGYLAIEVDGTATEGVRETVVIHVDVT